MSTADDLAADVQLLHVPESGPSDLLTAAVAGAGDTAAALDEALDAAAEARGRMRAALVERLSSG